MFPIENRTFEQILVFSISKMFHMSGKAIVKSIQINFESNSINIWANIPFLKISYCFWHFSGYDILPFDIHNFDNIELTIRVFDNLIFDNWWPYRSWNQDVDKFDWNRSLIHQNSQLIDLWVNYIEFNACFDFCRKIFTIIPCVQ